MDKVLEKHNKPTKDIEILKSILSSKEIELITKHLPLKRIQAPLVSLVSSLLVEERITTLIPALPATEGTARRAGRRQTRACGAQSWDLFSPPVSRHCFHFVGVFFSVVVL